MNATSLGSDDPDKEKKIFIEKDTFVQADVLSIHFDKKLWGDDAEEFLPERCAGYVFIWVRSDTEKQCSVDC